MLALFAHSAVVFVFDVTQFDATRDCFNLVGWASGLWFFLYSFATIVELFNFLIDSHEMLLPPDTEQSDSPDLKPGSAEKASTIPQHFITL